MNTIWADTASIHDDLTTPDELAEAQLLRDSLRRLAAVCTDDPRPAAHSPIDSVDDAVPAVNRAVTYRPHARPGRLQDQEMLPAHPIGQCW